MSLNSFQTKNKIMNENPKIAITVAKTLLKEKAVTLEVANPFTWKSGLRAPIYCDNRDLLSEPLSRNTILYALNMTVSENFDTQESFMISGVATAGIPWGMMVASHFEVPFSYVRPEAKDHGKGKQIEGKVKPGQKVIVIEDLISTGGSSLAAVQALRDQGADVIGVVSIFSYAFTTVQKAFEEAQVPLYTVCDYPILLQVAKEIDYIDDINFGLLENWSKDPSLWSQNFLNSLKINNHE